MRGQDNCVPAWPIRAQDLLWARSGLHQTFCLGGSPRSRRNWGSDCIMAQGRCDKGVSGKRRRLLCSSHQRTTSPSWRTPLLSPGAPTPTAGSGPFTPLLGYSGQPCVHLHTAPPHIAYTSCHFMCTALAEGPHSTRTDLSTSWWFCACRLAGAEDVQREVKFFAATALVASNSYRLGSL